MQKNTKYHISQKVNQIIDMIPAAKGSAKKDMQKLELSISLKKWEIKLEKYLDSDDFILPNNINVQTAIGNDNIQTNNSKNEQV